MKEHPYSKFLHKITKPARYIGGEYNSVVKDWNSVETTMALCFPDLYDVGMSHLGTKILYSLINKEPDLYAERAFCPWLDLEEELRRHSLPLLSLETHRPLNQFDVVGFSLQYELTFTNILTMLDLGGIPFYTEERTLDDPLVIAGGPVATHAEPLAAFFDLILIGDGEEQLPKILRSYTQLKKKETLSRTEILIELSKIEGVYAPSLYERTICERTSMMVVDRPKYEGVPAQIRRTFIDDLDKYPFPDDSPIAVAQAIFDRMSIEIARGCMEGCRFCQAGVIYRPVRERHPTNVVETLISALEKSGHDEAAITALSTADYSCIQPLIAEIMKRFREKKFSLGISSLRAYGLDKNVLDEISSIKATGLTFAPEAGTQRLRDVINKNVTEKDIFDSCHRVFEKGWHKIKFYFMIGLPTEEDRDVLGIAKLGRQAYEIGKLYHPKRAQVVVSVSNHVPKPHTPFQWVAMASSEELARKQEMLRNLSRKWKFKFRYHDIQVSRLEGLIARGDYRMSALIEEAWRRGARFDSWDEQLNWDAWENALKNWEQKFNIDSEIFYDTLPLDGRLPWDHIHVGVDRRHLEKEYKKALAGRVSPPCGKPFQRQIHPSNLEEALAETRKLVCYHCGIECDLSLMRQKRLDALKDIGALTPIDPNEKKNARENAVMRLRQGKTPHDFQQGKRIRYRLRYTKLLPVSLQGHHDLLRAIPQIMHRASLPVYYSEGFSPRPVLSFGPALSLGVQSLGEYVDITLSQLIPPDEVLRRLNAHTSPGLYFTGIRLLHEQSANIAKRIKAKEYLVILDEKALRQLEEKANGAPLFDYLKKECDELMQREHFFIDIQRKEKTRSLDIAKFLQQIQPVTCEHLPSILEIAPEQIALSLTLKEFNGPSIRPLEIIKALFDIEVDLHHVIRMGCWNLDKKGKLRDPLFPNQPHSLHIEKAQLALLEETQLSGTTFDSAILFKPVEMSVEEAQKLAQ